MNGNLRRIAMTIAKPALALGIALGLGAAPVLAEKPEWAGEGKGHGKGKQKEKHKKHFDNDKRAYIRTHYEEEFRGGHCPPGLAKKRNGCMPPGQAKKWRMGQPLPRDVVIYDLPPALVVRIGVPPAGYRYVRVASDILMIAVGTRMVADAITDLGRL
jgi:Ni/Co efflux regulator RcnB